MNALYQVLYWKTKLKLGQNDRDNFVLIVYLIEKGENSYTLGCSRKIDSAIAIHFK